MELWNIPSRVATAGLVGLAVLDVVLAGVALRSTSTSGIDTSPLSSASVTGSSAAASGRTSAATGPGMATGTTTTAEVVPRTMLVALDNQRAWRASAGSCSDGGATLAATADGGRTWTEGTAPMRTIARLQTADGQAAFVIGADLSCTAKVRETSDGGATWTTASAVAGAWFRDPKDPRTVGAPGRATSAPCGNRAVVDLVVLSTEAAQVLCVDGSVRSSSDTGSSWTASGKVVGAVALAVRSADPTTTYVARLNSPGCAGIQILRVGQSVETSCLRSAIPTEPGQIALSLVDGGGWVTVGDTTMRSTDGLVTWQVS